MKLNKDKCKVLYLGQNNPQMGLSGWGLTVWGAKRPQGPRWQLNMNHLCALAAAVKANCVLDCITKSTVNRSRDVILTLLSTCQTTLLVSPVPKQHRKTGESQGKTMKMIRGLEHLTCEQWWMNRVAQRGEDKTRCDLIIVCQNKRIKRRLFAWLHSERTWGNQHKLLQGTFCLDIKMKTFINPELSASLGVNILLTCVTNSPRPSPASATVLLAFPSLWLSFSCPDFLSMRGTQTKVLSSCAKCFEIWKWKNTVLEIGMGFVTIYY